MSTAAGSIFVHKDPSWAEHGWTSVPNAVIRHSALSWDARALFAWLASHTEKFSFKAEDVSAAGPKGRNHARDMLRELEQHGWLTRHKARNPATGRHENTIYHLHPVQVPEEDRTWKPSEAKAPPKLTEKIKDEYLPRSEPAPERPGVSRSGAERSVPERQDASRARCTYPLEDHLLTEEEDQHTTARERASVDEPFAEVVIDPEEAAAAHLDSRPSPDQEHAPGADVESIHIARQIQRNRRRSDNIVELAKNAYIPESMPIVERFEQRTNRLSLDRKRKWCAAVTNLIKLEYSEEVIDGALDLCIAEGVGWGLLEDKALIVANRQKAAARASRPQSRSERVRVETESMYERMLAKDAAEAAEQEQLIRATPRAISGGTT